MNNQTLKIGFIYVNAVINECFNLRTLRSTKDCPMPGMLIEVYFNTY